MKYRNHLIKKSNELLLADEFKKFLCASRSGRRLTKSQQKFTAGSIKQYECVLKLLWDYDLMQQQSIRIVLMKKPTITIIRKEKKYWEKHFKKFLQYMYYHRGFYDTYAASVLKVLRCFFNYLLKEKNLPIGNFHEHFRVAAPVYTPLVLLPWQLRYLIENKDFENSLSYHLRRTKDIFIFGSATALRFSDLMKLKKSNIVSTGSEQYLSVGTQKTGELVKLPIPDYLRAIIMKYRSKTGVYILPRLANSNFNIQLRKLIERAGWTYTLPKIRHRMGRPVEIKSTLHKTLRFCDQVSSHTMRRTAITVLLMLGVPEHAVRRLSGHRPGSKEFYRYLAVAEEYVQDHIKKAHEKLLNS